MDIIRLINNFFVFGIVVIGIAIKFILEKQKAERVKKMDNKK